MKHAIRVVCSLFVLAALVVSSPVHAVKGRQPVPFTYVIMSDPQYPWWPEMDMPSSCDFDRADPSTTPVWSVTKWDWVCTSNDQTGESDASGTTCSNWTWNAGEGEAQECAAKIENQNTVDGIKDVKNLSWPHSGLGVKDPQAVIINGDLTAYFHPWQLDGYEKYYIDKLEDYWVLAGLGNHDYQNNKGSCSAGTLDDWKCYKNAVEFTREYITGARAKNFPTHWVDHYDPNSLSYSWSHGHYLFIQLHNYPSYEVNKDDHSVDKSWDWAKDQIAEADEDGKYVVLNFHDYYAFTDNQLRDLADTPVVLIFVGHQLSRLGNRDTAYVDLDYVDNKFGDNIPVWHSGHSGSPGYDHKILVAEFDEQSVTIAAIDVQDGDASFTTTTHGGSEYKTHTFSQPSDHFLMPPVKGFLAVGVPKEDVKKADGDKNNAGQVNITYWNDLGNISSGQFSQEPYTSTSVESDDHHGHAVATGDFNDDGYPDLAASAPKEDISGTNDAGLVSVVYGTDNGLTGDFRVIDESDVSGSEEAGDQVANSLAVGDFNGDGYDDLAMGVPYEDIDCDDSGGDGDGVDAGMVLVVYGSSSGLKDDGSGDRITQKDVGTCEADDRFGWALTAGDYDNDGYDDLVASAIGEDLDGEANTGVVKVMYGSSGGVKKSGELTIHQERIGSDDWQADGNNEAQDQFGWALATGDFNEDNYDDLAIGTPYEDVNCDDTGSDGDGDNAGKISIVYGGSSGLKRSGAEVYNSKDIDNNNCEKDDRLGYALAAGDFNGDGDDDLAVGAPGEDLNGNNDAGNVVVLFSDGYPDGIPAGSRSRNFNQSDDQPGANEANDHFGWALAAGDANLDGYDDLAIAVPDEDFDGANNNGLVYLLLGQSGGLDWDNYKQISASNTSRVISDGSDNDDQFGLALTITRAIRDETPPVLSLPGTIIEEATSLAGNIVTFNATATDDWDGTVPVLCIPPSGYLFPIFITTVLCSATDDAGNTAAGSFSVVIQDTTPPDLTLPADITEEATGAGGAIVTFSATATDIVDPAPTVSCIPPSGALFALGTTQVECTAFDLYRNSTSGSFNVNVVDTTPPDVTVPADITVTATKPAGADVSWTIADAVDIVDGDITPTCTPASGSTFAHGDTTVTCEATDAAGNTGSASFQVTVENAQPTADDQSVGLDEDGNLDITLSGNDIDQYPSATLSFHVVDDVSHGTLSGTAPDLNYAPDADWYGSDSFTFKVNDGDLDSEIATVSITVNPVNDAPVISIDRSTATLQYSDTIGTVNITATDVDDDPLTLSTAWSKDGGLATAGLPLGLSTAGGCTTTDYGESPSVGTSCAWTLSGQMLEPSGDYDVALTVTDNGSGGDDLPVLSDIGYTELLVQPEDASIAFDGGNTVAVEVTAEGSDASLPFELTFTVWESMPDSATFTMLAGDISNAVPEVSVRLSPVGPGATQSPVACIDTDNGMSGYAETLTFVCSFDAVPVNTYSVDVIIDGGYYSGADEDVLTVFDPSLGFTSGGGWFYWPGTTDKTNFGYTMKYNKKATNIQGSLMLIRHIEGAPEGEDKWRIKSNSLHGLALGSEADFSWATFDGKTTYMAPGVDNEGNHEFTVYVEDRGHPGATVDRFWLEVRDKVDDIVADLSMDEAATANAVTLEGGNIVVPH